MIKYLALVIMLLSVPVYAEEGLGQCCNSQQYSAKSNSKSKNDWSGESMSNWRDYYATKKAYEKAQKDKARDRARLETMARQSKNGNSASPSSSFSGRSDAFSGSDDQW